MIPNILEKVAYGAWEPDATEPDATKQRIGSKIALKRKNRLHNSPKQESRRLIPNTRITVATPPSQKCAKSSIGSMM